MVALFAALSQRWPPATLLSVSQPFEQYGRAYSFVGLAESPGSIPPGDTVNSESVVGFKPGDYSVLFGYQVDEFTCSWPVEHFIAWSHIYLSFTVKMSTLTHFHLSQSVRIIPFWTRQ